jgi:hypothetical protein
MQERWLVIYEDGHEDYFKYKPRKHYYQKPVNIRPYSDSAFGHGQQWDIERVKSKHIIKLIETP